MSRRPKAPEKAKKNLNGSHARGVLPKAKAVAPAKAKSAPASKSKAPAKAAAARKPAKPEKKPGKPAARSMVNGAGQRAPAAEQQIAKPAQAVAPKAPFPLAAKNGVHSKSAARAAQKSGIEMPAGYRPSEKEPFMNELQQIYFRQKLVAWKEEILREGRSTLLHLHEDTSQHADLADRATSETDRAIELRARDRQRKLIAKIDSALLRIEDGSYGYCEETGEPIGLKRLDARPIATLSLEAQERHERRERVYRDDRAE